MAKHSLATQRNRTALLESCTCFLFCTEVDVEQSGDRCLVRGHWHSHAYDPCPLHLDSVIDTAD